MRRDQVSPIEGKWRPPAATIGDMPCRRRTVVPGTSVLEVERVFVADPTLSSIVVSEPSAPVCLTRAWFFAQLTGRLGYGRSLYAKRPIADLPRPETLALAATTLIPSAAQAVLARPLQRRYDDVVVSFGDGTHATICAADVFAEVAHAHAYAGLHDALTGLPNRRLFVERLDAACAGAAADSERVFAVLFLDVDEFKTINDGLGHAAGDLALEAVAERLGAIGDDSILVARLGGDEFGVLLEGLRGPSGVLDVVERIASSLDGPVWIGGERVALGVSIGVALGDTAPSVDELVRNADLAMYAAKRRSKGSYAFYEPGMHAQALERLEVRSQLEGALDRDEFALVYQPIVELDQLSIAGAEALLRWERPRDGAIGPAQFIPVCEQSGLIVDVGRWVLQEACTQAARWAEAHPGHAAMRLSLNISPRQLREPSFVADVDRILSATRMDPAALVLEITENVFIEDVGRVVEQLAALKRLGVALALDDFGAGFSSLGYLSRMPIDILKLDRTFVAALGDSHDRRLLRGITALADSLDLLTVAEGVETDHQVRELQAAGCRRAQGYFFARPMRGTVFAALLGDATVAPTLPADLALAG